jgi:hypothetical protein
MLQVLSERIFGKYLWIVGKYQKNTTARNFYKVTGRRL